MAAQLCRLGGLLRGVRAPARGWVAVGRRNNTWKPGSREDTTLDAESVLERSPTNGSDQPATGTDLRRDGSFAELFRNSQLAKIGNPIGKKVEGEVIAVVSGNMYVDFGHKFHAVVPVPEANPEAYVKGARVIVRVRDLELTSHFLGDGKDTSLLEAEVDLDSVSKARARGT